MPGKPRPLPIRTIGILVAIALGAGAIAYTLAGRSRSSVNLAALTETVTQGALSVRIKASGTVVPVRTVNLSPKVGGKLVALLVEQGDRVSAGEIVARMDDANIRPQVARAQAALNLALANLEKLRNGARAEDIAAARARVDAARVRLSLAQTRLERNRTLAAAGAIPRDRFDEIAAEAQSAKASAEELQRHLEQLVNGSRPEDIAQAAAQVREAEASLQAAEADLEDTIVRAPFDGIVTQKYANVGAFVTPTTSASSTSSATSTSIVALANGLEILAKVPEVDIAQIRVGQVVDIVADAHPDRVFRGKVRLIAPEAVIEQNVTSFQVRVALETGGDTLLSGMNVDLQFRGQTIANALTVPTVAIVTELNKTGVLVPDPAKPARSKFVPVTLGSTIGNRTQILSGLKAGDRFFVTPPEARRVEGDRG